jgi:hypothetical protein
MSPVGEPYAFEFEGYEEQDQQQQQEQQQQLDEGKYSTDNPCYLNTPLHYLLHMHVSKLFLLRLYLVLFTLYLDYPGLLHLGRPLLSAATVTNV